MKQMSIGRATLTWLDGGVTHMDGGAMFGVVPKPLWSRKYPANDKNQIELRTDPILIELDGKKILIDSGIGNGKLSEKERRNYGVLEESNVEESLQEMGYTTEDIDYVFMTHLHFDHACGLTKPAGNEYVSTFPNATIMTSETEWNEMRNPNIRSKNTYWERNWKSVEGQVTTFRETIEILPGLRMIHTGGHSDGHCVIVLEDGEDVLIHMADIMPTHAHQNVLWVLAYDDYPMTSIQQKQKWMEYGYEKQAWFLFYHDAKYCAIKFDSEGNITDQLNREVHTY